MRVSPIPSQVFLRSRIGLGLLLASLAMMPLVAQSNRTAMLMGGGLWRLHARVPLGSDSLLLQPSHHLVQMLATAEAPEFEGWQLLEQHAKPVLLDATGKPVENLPRSITFRVTVGTREKFGDLDPMPFNCSGSLNDFLLDMHFKVQIFRGMQMRQLEPLKAWMIGVPADEPSDERIYRASFNLGEIRPDDRIVLLVTDGEGARLSRFHLEFL